MGEAPFGPRRVKTSLGRHASMMQQSRQRAYDLGGTNIWTLMVVPEIRAGGRDVDGECATLICGLSVSVNWWGLLALLVTATAIALVARTWSGGSDQSWGGHRPVVWFLVVVFLPPVGLVLFCIAAVQQIRSGRRSSQSAG